MCYPAFAEKDCKSHEIPVRIICVAGLPNHGLNLVLPVYEVNYSLLPTFDASCLEYTVVTKYNTVYVKDAT
jgi:hypothetical protein